MCVNIEINIKIKVYRCMSTCVHDKALTMCVSNILIKIIV